MIRASLGGHAWGEIIDLGIVPDRRDALVEAVAEAAKSCDVLVTTGGVSAGDEDHVVGALTDHGAKLDILKVAMRPGKRLKIGLVGDVLFAGLPGNPNAALVTFHQIALLAIRARAGLAPSPIEWQPGVAGFRYEKRPGRTEFVTVRVAGRDDAGRPVLDMLGRGSSASLVAMARADGIAVLPPGVATIENGLPLRYEPFCRC
jgi:molybdopterin molybdotransferase